MKPYALVMKRKPAQLPDPLEFQIAPLSDDRDFQRAKAELSASETQLAAAEERYRAALLQPPAEAEAAARRVASLRPPVAEGHEQVIEVTDRKSYEVCRAFRVYHDQYCREALASLEVASLAIACMMALHARITAAGYMVRTDVLPANLPPAVYALGTPSDFNSAISRFARWMKERGTID